MVQAAPKSSVEQRNSGNLEALLKDLHALEQLGNSWPASQRDAATARAQAVDDLNAEAFRRLIKGLQDVPGMKQALQVAVGDEIVYAVLRRHGILKPSLFERVEAALENIRPQLASHGGDVALLRVEPPEAEVRFLGACDGCPASALTFYAGVKKAIQSQVPEITRIKQAKGLGEANSATLHYVSPFSNSLTDDWRPALPLADIAVGETHYVEVDGQSVLLSRFEDKVTCFSNLCAHMGMAMDGGEITAGILTCPYHGFQYALDSGECLTAPEVQLKPHAVRVEGGHIEIRIAT